MFGFFGWLKSRVRAAVLEGVSEAVQELEHGTPAEAPEPMSLAGLLQRRLTVQAPAAPEAEPVANGRGRKAVRDA